MNNRLISEELNYDRQNLRDEYSRLVQDLNREQKIIHERVLQSVHAGNGKLFFVSGHGGTSCKGMLHVTNYSQVLKKLDMRRFIPRLPFVNDHGRAFLAMLSNYGIKFSQLLYSLQLMYSSKKKDIKNGIESLITLAKDGSFQPKYNCAIALILLRRRCACKMFENILLLVDCRYTLKQMRQSFLQMVPLHESNNFPYSHYCLHNNIGKVHWLLAASAFLGDKDLAFDCVYCCMDTEIFKLKKKIH
ncbi:hypothetical protein ACFE04_011229 [Oxalis oulophora]